MPYSPPSADSSFSLCGNRRFKANPLMVISARRYRALDLPRSPLSSVPSMPVPVSFPQMFFFFLAIPTAPFPLPKLSDAALQTELQYLLCTRGRAPLLTLSAAPSDNPLLPDYAFAPPSVFLSLFFVKRTILVARENPRPIFWRFLTGSDNELWDKIFMSSNERTSARTQRVSLCWFSACAPCPPAFGCAARCFATRSFFRHRTPASLFFPPSFPILCLLLPSLPLAPGDVGFADKASDSFQPSALPFMRLSWLPPH